MSHAQVILATLHNSLSLGIDLLVTRQLSRTLRLSNDRTMAEENGDIEFLPPCGNLCSLHVFFHMPGLGILLGPCSENNNEKVRVIPIGSTPMHHQLKSPVIMLASTLALQAQFPGRNARTKTFSHRSSPYSEPRALFSTPRTHYRHLCDFLYIWKS